ncbi:MAG: HEAT repeat domain-containing protein, partial [Vicinamibacteria bacterium]
HFHRSANQEKARRYEQMRRAYGEATFNGEEAVNYSGELPELDAQTELPLDEESLRVVHDLLRSVLSAVRSLKLYPSESPAIARARRQVKEVLDRLLAQNPVVRLSRTQRTLRVNDQPLKVAEHRSLTEAFIELMDEADLDAIRFRRVVPEEELDVVLQTLAELEPKKIGRRFWRKLREEKDLQHVEPQQLPSSAVRRVRKSRKGKTKRTGKGSSTPAQFGPEEELRDEELTAVPNILRAFLGAAKNARLYPIDSPPVTRAVKELHDALATVLNKRAILNLACAGDALIVNGAKVNTHDYAELTQSFLAFVGGMQLNTISFSAELSEQDVGSFIDALRQVSARRGSDSAWDELVEKHELTHVSVNQASYELAWRQPGDSEEPVASSDVAELEEKKTPSKVEHSIANAPLEQLQADFPVLVWKLLEDRHSEAFSLLVGRLFEDYASRHIEQRERTIQAVSHAFEHVNLAKRSQFAQAALHDLLECLRSERDPKILPMLVAVLNQISMESIQIGDSRLAGLVVQGIREQRKRLREDEPALVGVLDGLLRVDVDVHASSIVQEDLCSDAVNRHRRATEFLGVLGEHGIPISIEIIKQEKSIRVRQLAARMLADLGPAGGRELKRALALEITVEQRFRILEVIDLVTRDLKTEITYSLGDANPKIRRAAFRLAERMKDNQIIEVVVPFAHREDLAVVKGTIRSLAQMGSIAAAKAVAAILDKTRAPELAIVCCQALGQIGDPASVEALVKALGRRRRFGLGRWWPPQVRATAALALAQIRHRWAKDALKQFARDPEPQVRQIAISHPEAAAASPQPESELEEPATATMEEEEAEEAEPQVVTKSASS